MTRGNKIMWKRGEIAPKFLLFSTIFSVYLYFQESNYIFVCKMWLFDLFFSSILQIWYVEIRISRSISESLGLRDNESRLYFTAVSCAACIIWLTLTKVKAALCHTYIWLIISWCMKRLWNARPNIASDHNNTFEGIRHFLWHRVF